MAVTSSDQRDYAQCFCTKQNGCKADLDAHSENKGQCVIKKKKETQQHLSQSMCTCITVDIVDHSSLDLFAPTNIHRRTTTKVSVTEGSKTAAITTKQNHMWTKASVSATQEESMWSNWIYTLPPRGRERRVLNWAFCTLSIELEIETAKSKQCEKMMWRPFWLSRRSWKWPKAAVWPAVSHTQRWQ